MRQLPWPGADATCGKTSSMQQGARLIETLPTLSVICTTRNRAEELRRTCRAIRGLRPEPLEIIITADGCEDDTIDVIHNELPHARVIVNDQSMGSVASRDRMIREARGDLVLTLDDDSYPEQSDCIPVLQRLFLENPSLVVATFPQRTDEYPETLEQVDFGGNRATRTYPSSGACLRASTYRSLPGYETLFVHAYEEPDYSLQCVSAGWDIHYFPGIIIRHHFSSANRNEMRTHHRHARNEIWSVLIRCPFPQVCMLIAWRLFSHARYASGRGMSWLLAEPVWWCAALRSAGKAISRRNPLPWAGYRKWLGLPG